MPDRREVFGRAALEVIAGGGVRALTHRAVDVAAGLPPGSVNYYAPSRAKLHQLALVEAYNEMYAIAGRAFTPVIEYMQNVGRPTRDVIVDGTVAFVEAMTDEGRGLVVARHALLIEAQFDDDLRELVTAHRARFIQFTDRIALASNPELPDRYAELTVALIEGLIQQQTLVAHRQFSRPLLRVTVARLYGFRDEVFNIPAT
ncbi:TetR/AcrR family transcriptional regulator [Gordonia soli]|uniref:Putative TetR family transcriptional regulator n=1 Tax=Gordonia soli NBRC 108243 TaxID=1223545 RepID=M0QFS7_9ACTN|nr:TetR family transcriptional regulator [Gordonia soli]GAC67460.1 putative TetR family transcriptional regulator [Gordonia soli NBRC 108243]